ncbi:VOC family protein [Photobacterium sp. TLY01]|uniref:VOC family protein n=1 Tax=Photobacterium sp. TLY01 TaxID=2907534 RepID=UPI001F26DD9C|nr:VOC family protein [Photobacterium sp. TLY01]UIP30637.1 VOC family protein [Photobacterium sp. TLY01]
MISHVLLGTNDLPRAERFYDALLMLFGAKKTMKTERSVLWQTQNESVGIAIGPPHNGQTATSGNGSMIGLQANSPDMVTAIYQKALELGGTDAGEPGERKPGVFAAYFRDPDNNKLGVFFVQC